eukprot:gene42624-9223_t
MGLVSIYERSDEKELYRKLKTIKVDPRRDADGTTVAGNESDCVMYVIALQSDAAKPDAMHAEALVAPFHSGAITGVDTCVRKPLVATCSKDRTIRIWNYMDHKLEIHKPFAVEAMSIALHPRLRFMNLYGDDIKEYKAFPRRSCPECRFSNGGQYFAFVIEVYSTYTCEPIHQLRGPTGKIHC